MCTIAGYIGEKRAAPVLLEMLKREESFDSGYYSGIATIHEGRLYYAKLTGDVSRLEALTDAASLPGNIGIIHSRTKSGGGDAWAQPFIGTKDGKGEPYIAYVANGSQGIFAAEVEKSISPIANELFSLGYGLPSKCKIDAPRYATLPDGEGVHSSEVMAQQIMRYVDGGAALSDACEKAFCDMPGEIVGLAISLSEPETISFARINQPMNVAFCSHGVYVGTTAMCFPSDASEPSLLPAFSSGTISRGDFRVKPFEKRFCTVAPLTPAYRGFVCEYVQKALGEKKRSFGEMRKMLIEASDRSKYDIYPVSQTVYECIKHLLDEGKIGCEITTVAGVSDGITAPLTMFYLN